MSKTPEQVAQEQHERADRVVSDLMAKRQNENATDRQKCESVITDLQILWWSGSIDAVVLCIATGIARKRYSW